MATVVFAGVQGSGKTVLLSVLALRYKSLISPLNEAAGQFYKDACKTLNRGLWPAPTNPLEQTKPLEWICRFAGSRFNYLDPFRRLFPTHLVYVDHAGEAWRWFTAKYQDRESENIAPGGNIPEQSLKNMEEQFAKATCVCLVLDMESDINDPNQKNGNIDQQLFVAATLNFLKKIGKDNIPICVVITKCSDRGRYNQQDAESAFNRHYKKIFQNRYWNNYAVKVTNAVANTKIGKDGKPYPEINFTSSGMDKLLSWIAKITSPWRIVWVCCFWFCLILVIEIGPILIIPWLPLISMPIVIFLVISHFIAAKNRCGFLYSAKKLLIKIFRKGK